MNIKLLSAISFEQNYNGQQTIDNAKFTTNNKHCTIKNKSFTTNNQQRTKGLVPQ